jgi:cell division protein FtsQ
MRPLIYRSRADAQNRPDPAPSRWGYRYQRVMLTPGVRGLIRLGLPLLVVGATLGPWYAQPANRDQLATWINDARENFQQRPQFSVQSMQITGAPASVQADVVAILPQVFPVSSFDLDLEAIRASIEVLEPVKSASVRVGPAGVLQVNVTPRIPVTVWRDGQILRLIDAQGAHSGQIAARHLAPDLPLIIGTGAPDHITEALAIFASAGPLADRVRGLVRMGERRWDVVLDRGQRILLPATGAPAAFDRVIALHAAQDMLSRDVLVVDMRNASRPTLRLTPQATDALRAGISTAQFNQMGN